MSPIWKLPESTKPTAYGIEADLADVQLVRDLIEYLCGNWVSYKAPTEAYRVGQFAIQNVLFGRKDQGHAANEADARTTKNGDAS